MYPNRSIRRRFVTVVVLQLQIAMLQTSLLFVTSFHSMNHPSFVFLFQKSSLRRTIISKYTTSPIMQSQLNADTNTNYNNENEIDTINNKKYITFIRHGCTYMNEYLGGVDGGTSFGSPGFTDIFDPINDPQRYNQYMDSKLSPRGLRQVNAMSNTLLPPYVLTCDLIVVSPLTRALQTFDIGLKGHFQKVSELNNTTFPPPKIVALPLAAERLYLISDVGRPTDVLKQEYPYIDFDTEFHSTKINWWYEPDSDEKYTEWRPTNWGQQYACPAESIDKFNQRMEQLYIWLQNRSEQNIIIVCHHGVIDWFLNYDFDNCQSRTLIWNQIRPKTLASKQQNKNTFQQLFEQLRLK